jgi:hypothetical protein
MIAHDELSMTFNNDEIILMEISCVENPCTFHPSTASGDEPNNWKFLQKSCEKYSKTSKVRTNESHDYMHQPLLLQCFLHFFDPVKLASHRTLILAQMWGEDVSPINTC